MTIFLIAVNIIVVRIGIRISDSNMHNAVDDYDDVNIFNGEYMCDGEEGLVFKII